MAQDWLTELVKIEALEDAEFDAGLLSEMKRHAPAILERDIRFSTPTFKEFETSEMSGCGKNSFPAFSITGAGCALNCDHCQKKILEPMIPATKPEILEQKVRDLILLQGLQGFLLSGGSNKKNEINYDRFLPVVEKLKHEFPFLKVAIHTALLDEKAAKSMESAGVDTAMMDVIGSDETIKQVYKLDRPVEDFEKTLAALCSTKMEISPHVVVGLHYGEILGEPRAFDIIAKYDVTALVLVVIMPFYAKRGTFKTPSTKDVGEIFLESRKRMGEKKVLLGCARPPGMHKRITDAYAVMAGIDGIAFPAEGAVSVAKMIGRKHTQEHACCSVKLGGGESAMKSATCAA